MKKIKFILFSFLMSLTMMCFAQSFDTIAHNITDYIDKNKNDTNVLLENVVNISSQTEQLNGVRKVGTQFEIELKALGFKTYWEEMPHDMNRAGNLFGVRVGTSGKRLLLIGHLDTVFPSSQQNKFQYLPNHWVKGIGVSDMKGGDVVMIEALKALQASDLLKDTTIAVALMGDEENTGQPSDIARKELTRLAKQSDVVLDFESGPPSLGRRGISSWKLTTTGTQQHSSLIFQPQVGNGAVYEIARILGQFAQTFSEVDNLTVNPSVVLGGSSVTLNPHDKAGLASGKINVVAKKAVAFGDLRYISVKQKLDTEQMMEKIVNAHYPKTQANITFTDIISPMAPTSNNESLLELLKSVNKSLTETQLTTLPPKLRGAGDISYIAEYVPAGLVGMGPQGKYEHSLDEIVDLDSIYIASKRAALMIYKLTHGQ